MITMRKLIRRRWFFFVVSFTIITLLSTYAIHEDSPLPLLAFRFALGFVLVSFVPGYCLMRILFYGDNKIDAIEGLVLSVALSFSIVGLLGIFLGLTGIGLNFASITFSLALIIFLLALIASFKAF
jgi:uncharacterized membrane protein